MTSAEISIIPEFKEKLDLMRVERSFRVRNRDITNLHTGSDILFRGIKTQSKNNSASLKSIQGVTTLVVEECEEVQDEEEFNKIDESIRKKGIQNRIILIFNPPTTDHWIYKRWFEDHLTYKTVDGFKIPMSNHPEVLHIHTTWFDNHMNLNEVYIRQILKIREDNPNKYAVKFLGLWQLRNEGVCFENWEEGAFDTTLRSCFGLDLGYFPDPLAFIRVSVDIPKKLIYAKEEIYSHKLSTEAVVEKIGQVLGANKRQLIVSDTNEPRLLDALKHKTKIRGSGKKTKTRLFNVVKAKKPAGSIMDDYRELQDWKIIVDPSSYKLKKELNNHVWNDKKSNLPIDDHNHLLDAMRYAWRRLTKPFGNGVRKP